MFFFKEVYLLVQLNRRCRWYIYCQPLQLFLKTQKNMVKDIFLNILLKIYVKNMAKDIFYKYG